MKVIDKLTTIANWAGKVQLLRQELAKAGSESEKVRLAAAIEQLQQKIRAAIAD